MLLLFAALFILCLFGSASIAGLIRGSISISTSKAATGAIAKTIGSLSFIICLGLTSLLGLYFYNAYTH